MNRIIATIAIACTAVSLSAPAQAEEFAHLLSIAGCKTLSADSLDGDVMASERGACFQEFWAKSKSSKDCDVAIDYPDARRGCLSAMAIGLNNYQLCQRIVACENCKDTEPPPCLKHFFDEDAARVNYPPIEKAVESNPGVASQCRGYALIENQEKCFWDLSRKFFTTRGDEVTAERLKLCLEPPSVGLFELCVRTGVETFLLEDNRLAAAFKEGLSVNPSRKKLFCRAMQSKDLYPKELRAENFFAASVKEFCPDIDVRDGALTGGWPDQASAMLLLTAPGADMAELTISILNGGRIAGEPKAGPDNYVSFHNRPGKTVAKYGIGPPSDTGTVMLMVPIPRRARDFELVLPGQDTRKTWIASTTLKQIISRLPSSAFNDPGSDAQERLLKLTDDLRALEEILGEDMQMEEHIYKMKQEAAAAIKPEYFQATPENAPPTLPVEALFMDQTFEILQRHFAPANAPDEKDCEQLHGVHKEKDDSYRALRDVCRTAQAGSTGGKSCEAIKDPISQARCMAQAAYLTENPELCNNLMDEEICENELKRMQAPPESDVLGNRRKALKLIEEIVLKEDPAATILGISSGD